MSLKSAVYTEQLATLSVIDELVNVEKTKSYLQECSSLFSYMTEKLKYSEGAAMRRINAARVVGEFPEVRELLRKREVSLCTVSLVAKEVRRSKDFTLIEEICGKSKREVEKFLCFKEGKVARRKEQVRKLMPPSQAAKAPKETLPLESSKAPASQSSPPPLALSAPSQEIEQEPSEAVYDLRFTVPQETYELLEELKGSMAHTLVGETQQIAHLFQMGLRALQEKVAKKRGKQKVRRTAATATSSQPSHSRYIPINTKRAVFERDQCKCQYRLKDGTSCGSTYLLELDHIKPYALGGESSEENLRVICREHNQLLARDAGLLR